MQGGMCHNPPGHKNPSRPKEGRQEESPALFIPLMQISAGFSQIYKNDGKVPEELRCNASGTTFDSSQIVACFSCVVLRKVYRKKIRNSIGYPPSRWPGRIQQEPRSLSQSGVTPMTAFLSHTSKNFRKRKRRTRILECVFSHWYARLDSNQWPTESESVTLSN